MLQIKNLTITHKKDLRTILKDFTFYLNKGDKAVIIGEEGNGKSTLLKLIYNDELISEYAEYQGEIIKHNLKLGYLAQELLPHQKEKTIYEFCTEVPTFYDLTPKELSDIAYNLGLSVEVFYSDQKLGTLSGGEKVKIQLAAILMSYPDVLLLDEPSNDLDIETLEWLEDFINSSSQPIIYISHDETLIERTANIIIHIEQTHRKTRSKHTIAKMSYKQYIEERLSKLSREEQLAKKERAEYEKKMEKYRQIYQRVEHEQNVISRQDPGGGRLLKKKMKSVKSMGRRFEKDKENLTEKPDVEEAIMIKFGEGIEIPNGKVVLDYNLDKLMVGDRILARNIKLNIIGPEKVCIVGKNGVGKSTLLKNIFNELSKREDLKVGYMPQNYEDLLDLSQTPVEYLAESGHKDEITKVRTFLGSMKYTALEMEHSISELSGGQKAKVLFLKMILDECNVLLLDEPTRNFSPLSNPVIRDVLKSYKGAIISISHDRKYIKEVCDLKFELTEEGG